MTVVLGSPHPTLQRLDWEYERDYPRLLRSAQLTRRPLPDPPRHLPATGVEVAVLTMLNTAIGTEELARRPEAWPAGTPVAARPAQHRVIGHVR